MENIDEQAAEWRRRLHQRELQKSRMGYSVDPSVITEIEDLQKKLDMVEVIKHQLELLTEYRGHTHQLLKQRAIYGGAAVPPHVTTQIRANRQRIAEIKRELLKGYGYAVEPDPSDEEAIVDVAGTPKYVNVLQLVRERIHTLEVLVQLGQKEAALETLRELRRIVDQ